LLNSGRKWNNYFFIIILFTILTIAINYVPSQYFYRIESLIEGNDTSAEGRILRFELAWQMFLESPILGSGTASTIFDNQILSNELTSEYAHNIFLEIASEYGLIGLIIWFLLLQLSIQYTSELWKQRKKLRSNFTVLFQTTLYISLVYLIFSSVSGNISSNAPIFIYLNLLSILYYSHHRNIISSFDEIQ
jgi:O-antigen ligase